MSNVLECFKRGGEDLLNHSSTPLLDSRLLMEFVLNIKSGNLYFYYNREISENDKKIFFSYIDRRIKNEPIAKIINKKAFWKNDFFVNENVLDPRPETELIIEAVLENYKDKLNNLSLFELGVGSGCIICSLLLEYTNSMGVATDISQKAIDVAKHNAENLNILNRANFLQKSWNEDIEDKFDIIISNPPYISRKEELPNDVVNFDPHLALFAENNGLKSYEEIAKLIHKNCKPNTMIFLEIGKGQEQDIMNIFNGKGFYFFKDYKDLAGIVRVLLFKFNEI